MFSLKTDSFRLSEWDHIVLYKPDHSNALLVCLISYRIVVVFKIFIIK